MNEASPRHGGRNPGIDLLRGLSIVLVVIHHTARRIPLDEGVLADWRPLGPVLAGAWALGWLVARFISVPLARAWARAGVSRAPRPVHDRVTRTFA